MASSKQAQTRLFLCLLIGLVTLIAQEAIALPPDFFRVGRVRPSSVQLKRGEDRLLRTGGGPVGGDDDVTSVVCSYCVIYYNPVLGAGCQNDNSDSRKACTAAFVRDMRAAMILTDE